MEELISDYTINCADLLAVKSTYTLILKKLAESTNIFCILTNICLRKNV